MKTLQYIFCFTLLLTPSIVHANNITVTNTKLREQNTAAKTVKIQFDLSWENSWRTSTGPANWDAAWVFVKFRVGASDPVLNNASSSGTTITVSTTSNLRVGMPIRVSSGTGAFAANTVISSITNATQFVVSAAPSTALSNATITCTRIWEHARLHSTDHIAATGSTIDAGLQTPSASFNETTNPALGVFVYRSSDGAGNNIFNNMQLRWNYGSNNISDATVLRVRVFAIEMVYVPEGSFFVGSGGTESGSLTNGSWMSGNTIPFQITSENALTIGPNAGNLWGTSTSGLNTIGSSGSLSASFPKGFRAFYCMKYEITQGQYRDFLNTLTRTQQNSRTETSLAAGTTSVTNRYVMSGKSSLTNRNGIRCDATIDANNPINFYCDLDGDGTPNESTDGEWIACTHLSLQDGTAYADWAGLRPMTELEFEKACRGTQAPVSDEYAWGTNAIASAAYTLSNPGRTNESISTNYSTTAGNTSYATTDGSIKSPLRVGIFATSISNRIQSGASYYGIMELSGNVWEICVNIINNEGRNYTGLHGDGQLSASGNANTAQWPGLITGGDWFGAGGRGGSFSTTEASLKVSGRDLSIYPDKLGNRYLDLGFRAVRTAPN